MTVSSFCAFTLNSVLIPLVLFVTGLVFSALVRHRTVRAGRATGVVCYQLGLLGTGQTQDSKGWTGHWTVTAGMVTGD